MEIDCITDYYFEGMHIVKSRKFLELAPYLALALVFIWHFAYVWRYAVDIPFWDEWDVWWTWDGTSFGDWLFLRHNEHRIVFTRLQILAAEKLASGDVAFLQRLNFILFALIVGWFPWMVAKTREFPASVAAAFSLFLLSPINHENHAWAFQSQFHFAVIFLLFASALAFREKPTTASLLPAAALAIASAFSLSAGIGAAAALGAVIALHAYYRGTLGKATLSLVLLALGIAACVHGHQQLQGHPALTLPTSGKFWRFFLNVVSFGFGYSKVSLFFGLLCLSLVLFPLAAHAVKGRNRLSRGYWTTLGASLSILAALSTIAIGRGGWGEGGAKSSRYAEFSLLLVPLSAMAWAIYLAERPRVKAWFLAGLWTFCFCNFANDWSMDHYAYLHGLRKEGAECVREYYRQHGAGECHTVFPVSLKSRLEKAQEIHGSVFRKMGAGS